jgi:ArsR family transcriptional regulator, lead/cadmium/zinc/bismuth-responsive transcriptional repressor
MRNSAINMHQAREEGIRPADVARGREAVLDDKIYKEAASLFGALADPTRARIVHVLAHQELCTADLALTLGLRRPAASQHLRLLRQLRIVRTRREGRLVFYSLDDSHVVDLLGGGIEHVRESAREG